MPVKAPSPDPQCGIPVRDDLERLEGDVAYSAVTRPLFIGLLQTIVAFARRAQVQS